MNNKILLISESQIKQASIIELNADSKVLSKVIIDVQKLILRPVLGDQLYNQVFDEVYQTVENTEHEMNPAIKILLEDYIKDFLISAIVQDWIITNNYKMTNKGMVKLSDSNASPISAEEIEYAKNYYDQKVSAYKLNLINYLKSQKLIDGNTDQDVTSESIGWYLQSTDNYKVSIPYDGSLVPNPSGPVSWDEVTDKPEEFNPAPHTHTYDSITGKPSTFTPAAHTHTYSSITDKPTEFNPSVHTHTYASITDKPASFTPSAHTHTINDITNLQIHLNAKADLVGGFVPASQLPSYVDDVVEAINFAALPTIGETGKMYVTVDNNKVHRWSGSTYIQIVASPGSTDEVPEGSVNKYFTDSRAIAALSSALSGKANTAHTHSVTDITDLSTYTGFDARYFTESEVSTLISTKADTSHTHSASDITSGTINSARLGSGMANSSTYLRGDGTWAAITSDSWGFNGNAITSGQFLGTTNTQNMVVKANGVTRVIIPYYNSTLGTAQTALGILGNSSIAIVEPTAGGFGLAMGVDASTGNSWIQSQRFDGGTTAYNMILQKNGGGVTIGTSTLTSGYKLDVNGDIAIGSVIGTRGNSDMIFKTDGTTIAKLQNDGGLALGQSASAGGWGVAIGWVANAQGQGIAIGRESYATGYSSALGNSARSEAIYSIALGINARAAHEGAVVISSLSHTGGFLYSDTTYQFKAQMANGYKFMIGTGTAVSALTIKPSGVLNIANTPTYPDNAAAVAGGLLTGDIFKTPAGDLKILL